MAFYRCGGGGIPSSLKTDMNAVLNKKFGTSTTYDPSVWASTANLMGPLPERTATGSIAHITDGADEVPLKSWEVEIAPTLTGKSAIECTENTGNFFNEDWEVGGINDATGVPNSDTDKIRSKTFSIMKGGATYYAKTPNNIRVLFYASDYSFISETVNIMNTTFTAPSNCVYFKIRGTVAYGTTYNNDISINASGDTDYHAYTAPTLNTVNLGRTIYGGTADVVKGTCSKAITETKTFDGSDDENWLYSSSYGWFYIDNQFGDAYRNNAEDDFMGCNLGTQTKYSSVTTLPDMHFACTSGTNSRFAFKNTQYSTVEAFKEWLSNNNMIVAYTSATFTPFTFTPITPTPETALGVNNFWSDSGDTKVTYRADINLALGGQ